VGSHGNVLVKPLFVVSCASLCGLQAYMVCHEASSPELALWAPAVGAVVGLLTLKLWHLAYSGFLFLFGCLLGGTGVFLCLTMLASRNDPPSLLGATVLGALLTGLSFVRFYDVYWRLLLPAAGGLLVAAGLRYFAMAAASPDAKWSEFALDLRDGGHAVLSLSGVTFWASWVVAAVLGWYLQLTPLMGLREQLALVPAWAVERFPSLLGPDGLLGPGAGTVSRSASDSSVGSLKRLSARKLPQLPGSLEPAGKPLLGLAEGKVLEPVPRHVSIRQAAVAIGTAVMEEDYRPEVALVVAVASVMSLNWFLMAQPLLFLGHAVLMSTAFLILATAGMVSYASKSLLLPRLFGPQRGSKLPRHFTHGAFNGLALACALGGYACIYQNHKQVGASQLGLDIGNSWGRFLHVWIGYLVLLLLLVQALSGVAKLYIVALLGERRLRFHHKLGRTVYCLAATNQLVGYTFPGLLPTWAAPVLASMLITTVGATLFFLQERNRLQAATFQLEEERMRLEELTAKQSSSGSLAPPARESSQAAFETAVMALTRESSRFVKQKVFTEWHRLVQQKRLDDAAEAMEGQDRLVQFLSQEIVEGGASTRRQSTVDSDAVAGA